MISFNREYVSYFSAVTYALTASTYSVTEGDSVDIGVTRSGTGVMQVGSAGRCHRMYHQALPRFGHSPILARVMFLSIDPQPVQPMNNL